MCGFIGIYGPEGVDVAGEIYEGLLSVQHRGQDAAGIITFTDSFHVKKGRGLVLEIFHEGNMARLTGNLGVGHVRYPTLGASEIELSKQCSASAYLRRRLYVWAMLCARVALSGLNSKARFKLSSVASNLPCRRDIHPSAPRWIMDLGATPLAAIFLCRHGTKCCCRSGNLYSIASRFHDLRV